MTNEKGYEEGIRVVRSVGKVGKTIATIKLILIICLVGILILAVVFIGDAIGLWAITNGDDIPEDDFTPSTKYNIIPPTLDLITPSTDGNIELNWDDAESLNSDLLDELEFSFYRVLRRKYGGTWSEIKYVFNVENYNDLGLVNGNYEYKIQAVFYKPVAIERHCSDYSNIQLAQVGIITLPSNPKIIINDDGTPDGANETSSFEVTLTLYCDDAVNMSFQVAYDTWTNWIDYVDTYDITLQEEYLQDDIFRVGVIFRNDDGESDEVFDDIYYNPEATPPNGNGEEDYYIWAYVLVGVLGAVIGIAVFLKYKKKF